jgi:hypothetical protein
MVWFECRSVQFVPKSSLCSDGVIHAIKGESKSLLPKATISSGSYAIALNLVYL